MTTPQLYSCLRYADAEAAIKFVTALGFTERLVVRSESDPSFIEHAQFRWRDNGGIMFGSDRDDGGFGPNTGTAFVNLVVSDDQEVDRVLAAALAAGADQQGDIREPPYGGRSVGVTDAEGNSWHIDSYPGE